MASDESGRSETQTDAAVERLLLTIKRGVPSTDLSPSLQVAIEAINFYRNLLSHIPRSQMNQMLTIVRNAGRRLGNAHPYGLILGNITRRILYIIREGYEDLLKEPETETRRARSGRDDEEEADVPSGDLELRTSLLNPTLSGLASASVNLQPKMASEAQCGEWKRNVISHITETLAELKDTRQHVNDCAQEHIYADEVILTYGKSRTVEGFLKHAARKVKFEVMVADRTPGCQGQELARSLADAGIKTTLWPEASVFAVMSRVSKVLVGTYAVLATGGLLAPSGTHMVALAAKAHSVPLVVCTGLYKLSPVYPVGDPHQFADLSSPAAVLPLEHATAHGLHRVHVRNPSSDYIPPDLVHTYLTNRGGLSASYIYRLVSEFYNPEDYDLSPLE